MDDEILIEIRTFGNMLKVSAVHALTGTEVSFIAPKNTPMLSIKMLAKQKLEYVINKDKN
ncbi:MAG: hypothetical protein MJ250_00705 [Alphaproteobacteria bacterium]|nr:hypothetical protein [Alphaproteobacteria bacterium]